MKKTGNLIVDLSFEFAIRIVAFTDILEQNKKFVVARQLLKSGTSIGANVHEAQNCESKIDFIHKLKIAAKEADETEYWLLLCQHAAGYPFQEDLLENLLSIKRVLSKIIISSKK
jgi:four helix bundle protein